MDIDWNERVIRLHQSDINTFLTCPEEFKAIAFHGLRQESDAALVGTTLHSVIEAERHNPFDSNGDATSWAATRYLDAVKGYDEAGTMVRSSFATDAAALRALSRHVYTWWESVDRAEFLSTGGQVEWAFDVPFMEFDDYETGALWQVRLAGTSDWMRRNYPIVDWKTASRKYLRWEKQRWAIQPTVYSYAADHEGIPVERDDHGDILFEFRVFMIYEDNPEHIMVTRGQRHWDWLKIQVEQMVRYILDNDPGLPWMVNDQHVLCSPKWCPNWGNCKGKFVDEGRW